MADQNQDRDSKDKKKKAKRERVATPVPPDVSSQASGSSSDDNIGHRLRSKKLKLNNNNNKETPSQSHSSTSNSNPKAAKSGKEPKKKVSKKGKDKAGSTTTNSNNNSQESQSSSSPSQEKENIDSSQASEPKSMASQESTDNDNNDNDENLSQDPDTSSQDQDASYDLDSALEPSSVKINDDFPFEILSIDDLVNLMIKSINEVNDIVELHPTKLRILLNHFRWDKEKLLEAFYDGDQEKLFKDANIATNLPTTSDKNNQSSTEDCNICFIECNSSMMYDLGCFHRFCRECWASYLTTKIMEEGVGQTISCPAFKCPILVDDQSVMGIVTSDVKVKYQQLITNSFVQCNKLLTWCPGPGCTKAIKVKSFERKPVTCTCGVTFCFSCSREQHDPISCQYLKKWIKKCDDDSETMNWLAINTKDCPQCHTTIEKNGGCNHMTCRNKDCNHQFCWICAKPWENHQACNKYEEPPSAKEEIATKRAALKRYVFYSSRYMNHLNSFKKEGNLYGIVKDKMEELAKDGSMSWIETHFLKDAVDSLVSCRRTLMYTYAFAYYLVKNNQSAIFEDNQADLERVTEELSGYLERDASDKNNKIVGEAKQKVQDLRRYCDGRRKVLLDHVDEGYENDWWKHNDTPN